MLRRLLRTAAVVGVFLGASTAIALWYAFTPLAVAQLPAQFEIPPGAGLRSVARRIEAAGIRVRPLAFELLARSLGRAQEIKAGSYELASAPTPLQLLEKLSRGDVTLAELRFIEGWTFRQLRATLDAHPGVRHETAGLADSEILRRLGSSAAHPEGWFFPDTYLFSPGTSDLRILQRAHEAMQRHLARAWEVRDPAVPYASAYEALVMASIVEKETGRAEERDRIAGVLVNRLRRGMLLQADPTVIYGLGESFDGNLRRAHLNADGPYNSYTRAGLPPTPIAAPGLAALTAATRPAKTEAFYYVARGDGSSEFSRTLEEHNRAVRKYQLHGRR